MNSDELYEMFAGMTIAQIKTWLRKYVDDGQPDEMNATMTFRALCRCASMAVEGTPKDDYPSCYMETKYGSDFYWYMIGFDDNAN